MKNATMHNLVNWTDGMKVNKAHFVVADNFHLEQNQLSAQIYLNDQNFGLLPVQGNYIEEPGLNVFFENDQILISRFSFSLIMPDGTTVIANSDDMSGNRTDQTGVRTKFLLKNASDKDYVLIIKSSPFERIEYGELNPDDLPMRRPYALKRFDFTVTPEKQVQDAYFGPDFFVLARFSLKNNVVVMDEDYVPPVTCMASMTKLRSYHATLYEMLLDMETYIQKTFLRHRTKMSNVLSDSICFIAGNLLQSLSRIKFHAKHLSLYQPPVHTVILIKELANVLYHSIELRTSFGKDSFMTEINKTIGISKNEFESGLKKIINLEYRHYNIAEPLQDVMAFTEQLRLIFKNFSEHDKSSRKIDIIIEK